MTAIHEQWSFPMPNGNEWHQRHNGFLSDAHALLARSQECLAHLKLIGEDQDAIDGLSNVLQHIAASAGQAGVSPIADFAGHLRHVLYFANTTDRIAPDTLAALERCFSLLAWQIELIDPATGHTFMDDAEQHALLERVSRCAGVGRMEAMETHLAAFCGRQRVGEGSLGVAPSPVARE
jgi:chemotaxis protein histidine kinase CheA